MPRNRSKRKRSISRSNETEENFPAENLIKHEFTVLSYDDLVQKVMKWDLEDFETFRLYGEKACFLPEDFKTNLKQVLNTYRDQKRYYETNLNLVILDAWLNTYNFNYYSKERNVCATLLKSEKSNRFCSFTAECFSSNSDEIPRKDSIVLFTYRNLNNILEKRLGIVSQTMKREFALWHDRQHKAYKALYISSTKELLKYKIKILVEYDIKLLYDEDFILIKNLGSIRSLFLQNKALISAMKSRMQESILRPICSTDQFSILMKPEYDDIKLISEQLLNRMLQYNSMICSIHTESSSFERTSSISYLINKIRLSRPEERILVCSKSKQNLMKLYEELKHMHPILLPAGQIHSSTLSGTKMNNGLGGNCSRNLNGGKSKTDCESKSNEGDLKESRVFIASITDCSCRYMKSLSNKLNFFCCILDEANLCTEAESVVPLANGIVRYIMLGNKNICRNLLPILNSYEYQKSLFHRNLF